MTKEKAVQELATRITKELADQGQLIEGGWRAYVLVSGLQPGVNIDESELAKLRNAYFLGAQHLFASIMNFLDAGDEATTADLRKMDFIHQELRTFIAEYKQTQQRS